MPLGTNPYEKLFFDLGVYTQRASASLPQTATTTQYTVFGVVEITAWLLEVTTAIQAQANAIKGRHTPTGGSVGDVSGTLDINGFAVGDFIVFQGPTSAGALSQSPTSMRATTGATGLTSFRGTGGILLRAGALGLNTAASSTGALKSHIFWRPILPGSKVVPA
jgi:hypothetical protein